MAGSDHTIALSACVLAAAAFIVAFLQVLLQYLGSSEVRQKCTKPAIGLSAKQVRRSWSFRSWKMKIYYPLLRLDTGRIIFSMMKNDVAGIEYSSTLNPLTKTHNNWVWRSVSAHDRLTTWIVADDSSVLWNVDEGRAISISDLTWKESLLFIKYRLLHPLQTIERPRASWAQLLVALGIRDTKGLMLRLVDAETVHSILDTPVQRIHLRDLGQIAFLLGFQSVFIDVPNRIFRAYSPVGSITTEEVPVIGKVLRFEGDIHELHTLVSRCSSWWVFRARSLIIGRISFGKYLANGMSIPLATISNAIMRGIASSAYDDLENEVIRQNRRQFSAGPVLREAYLLNDYFLALIESKNLTKPSQSPVSGDTQEKDLPPTTSSYLYADSDARLRTFLLEESSTKGVFEENEILGCMAKWQRVTSSTLPTLLAASTFLSLHGVVCAYPSRAVLHSVLPWTRHRAKKLFAEKHRIFVVSENFSDALRDGDIGFARENSKYLLATGAGSSATGSYGWGITNMKSLFDLLPQQLQQEIIPTRGEWKVNAVLTSETSDLLRRFEPQKWAKEVSEKGGASLGGFKVINLLWIQVLILDISIQFYLYGRWDFRPIESAQPAVTLKDFRSKGKSESEMLGDYMDSFFYAETWGKSESEVVRSIVKAWRPQETEAEYAHAAHAQQSDVVTLNSNGEENESSDSEEEVESDEEQDGSDGGLSNTSANELSDEHGVTDWASLAPGLQDWPLAKHLEQNQNVFPGHRSTTTKARCRRLAHLLELRAIFVIALLFMHPDSSDIYMTEGEDIEMPIG